MSRSHVDHPVSGHESDNQDVAHGSQGLGVMLRRARESRGMTEADLGRRLNLSAATVEALEREDLQALPGIVYVRGYLRRLAPELGLDEAELQRAHARIAGEAETALLRPALLVEPMDSPRRRVLPLLLLLLVALGIVAAGAYGLRFLPETWVKASGETGSQVIAPLPGVSPATPQKSVSLPPLPPPPLPEVASEPESAARPVVGEVVPAQDEVPEASPPVESAPALELNTSSAESWVQVRDASGRILLEEVLKPGTSRQVDGARPLQVRVGNAAATTLVFEGQAVDLSPHTRSSGTALVAGLGG